MTEREEDLSAVVVEQALALARQTRTILMQREKLGEIQGKLVCIGQPLNDSRIKYTNEQLKPFHDINDILEE